MSVLRDRAVLVLLVLVLAGSALCVALAVTRPGVSAADGPPEAVGTDGEVYVPADLVGPGGDALEAAVAALPLTLTYDHADLDASLTAATATMTPAYAREFAGVFDRRVRAFARRRDAVSEGVVRGAGVVRTTDDTAAVCLVYLDQVLLEGRGVDPEEPEVIGRNRVRVELVRRDGAWLVARISGI
jgi:Mce-associated membrane protein